MAKKSTIILVIFVLLSVVSCNDNGGVEKYTAFSHVNLIPMTDETIVEDQTIVIKDSKIIEIGNSDEVLLPKNTAVIDGEGLYLMPGLADMHMHTRVDWENEAIWPVNPLNLYLANGVTTIRDFAPSGSLTYALQRRDKISAGTRIGPAIFSSGELLYESPLDNVQRIVRQNNAMGFDFLKLYSYLSPDDFHLALVTAKELGMYTSGHIPYAVGLDVALSEGLDEIAHVEELFFEFIEFDRNKQLSSNEWLPFIISAAKNQWDTNSVSLQRDFEKDNEEAITNIAEKIKSARIPVCTTMVVDDVIQMKLFQPDIFLEQPENIYFRNGYLERFQRGEEKHQVQCRGIEDLCALKYEIDLLLLRKLHQAGVMLLLSTDSGTGGMGIVPGFSIHDELQILVENGFTPFEAISTGTVNAALVVERMTGKGDFGTIEVGKRADLILARGNPLDDVSNIRKPMGVMAAGNWFSENELIQMITISQ